MSIVVIILVALTVWSVKDGFLVILAAPYIYQYEEDRGKKGQQPHDGAGLNQHRAAEDAQSKLRLQHHLPDLQIVTHELRMHKCTYHARKT